VARVVIRDNEKLPLLGFKYDSIEVKIMVCTRLRLAYTISLYNNKLSGDFHVSSINVGPTNIILVV
jgi:hypothetical protein